MLSSLISPLKIREKALHVHIELLNNTWHTVEDLGYRNRLHLMIIMLLSEYRLATILQP